VYKTNKRSLWRRGVLTGAAADGAATGAAADGAATGAARDPATCPHHELTFSGSSRGMHRVSCAACKQVIDELPEADGAATGAAADGAAADGAEDRHWVTDLRPPPPLWKCQLKHCYYHPMYGTYAYALHRRLSRQKAAARRRLRVLKDRAAWRKLRRIMRKKLGPGPWFTSDEVPRLTEQC